MFFLTKILFKFIIIPILISLIIPLIFLLLMYQPLDLYYQDQQDLYSVNINEVFSDGLSNYLAHENDDQQLLFSIHENQINYYVRSLLQETNSNFVITTNYVVEENFFGYAGSWFLFQDNSIELVSKVDVFVTTSFSYETTLRILFQIEFDGEEIRLSIQQIYLGHLPVLWMLDVVAFGFSIAGIDIQQEISSILNQFGDYDQETKTVTIQISNLIASTVSDNETTQIIVSLLKGIQENQLISLKSSHQQLSLHIDINQLIDESTPYMLDVSQQKASYEEVFETWIASISYLSLFQAAFQSSEQSQFQYQASLESLELNQLLFITIKDYFPNTFQLGNYIIELKEPHIIIDHDLWIEVPLQILNTQEESIFVTKIKLQMSLTYNEDQGLITFEKVYLGQAAFDPSILSFLFQSLEIQIENNQLDITQIIEVLKDEILITAIFIQENKIIITIEPSMPTDALLETIEDIIEALVLLENLPSEIQEPLNEIVSAIQTNDIDSITQSFEELLMIYDALDDTIQSEIQTILYDYLASSEFLQGLLN